MRYILTLMVVLGTLFMFGASSCEEDTAQEQRERSIDFRAEQFAIAEKLAPFEANQNFPLRKALVKFNGRQDLENHPWYIYVQGDNGNTIGYFVSQTVPINACNFLSSTQDIRSGGVVTAPSLDGIYYGGGGSQGSCDAFFFFDYATDALVQIRQRFIALDQPLKLDVQPIEIQTN